MSLGFLTWRARFQHTTQRLLGHESWFVSFPVNKNKQINTNKNKRNNDTISETGVWSPLMTRGAPLNVQEHSMVYWNDNVYVFGGIFVAADECPLWTYHVPVN